MKEAYTPGYSEQAMAFMSRRRLEPNGAFFKPYLKPGIAVLDCGCGPGSITADIAQLVSPGAVVGLDASAKQLELAQRRAAEQGLDNVTFRQGSAYALPFPDGSFEAVFSHALLEHLSDAQRAVDEFFRVLKPGAMAGVCTPDWGAFIVAPETPAVRAALEAYKALQSRNGGDVHTGRRLGDYLERAGFEAIRSQSRFENYEPLTTIGDFLALNLEEAGDAVNAATWRAWARRPHGMFSQAWVWCTGRRPEGKSR
jgi:ubiquinone/menaquinone biosynthesis C-methylase UbiE